MAEYIEARKEDIIMTRAELLKTAKPILFNTENVRAILDGRKTVTRRILKNQDEDAYGWDCADGKYVDLICERNGEIYALANKLPCHTGDILYVREAYAPVTDYIEDEPVRVYAYKVSTPNNRYVGHAVSLPITAWHPSIHMPKEAARIFLQVTDVRVERLQGITVKQSSKEGCVSLCCMCRNVIDGKCVGDSILLCNCPIDKIYSSFAAVWDATVKKSDLDSYGWAANPWVWVIEFEKLEVQA